mmetsp:Transcript_3307/g.10152  ORF Transcript_3307/g.10152 Transcript_3307/m.10152 type:complete len:287 (+) Transcript_3307:151-1011(+)
MSSSGSLASFCSTIREISSPSSLFSSSSNSWTPSCVSNLASSCMMEFISASMASMFARIVFISETKKPPPPDVLSPSFSSSVVFLFSLTFSTELPGLKTTVSFSFFASSAFDAVVVVVAAAVAGFFSFFPPPSKEDSTPSPLLVFLLSSFSSSFTATALMASSAVDASSSTPSSSSVNDTSSLSSRDLSIFKTAPVAASPILPACLLKFFANLGRSFSSTSLVFNLIMDLSKDSVVSMFSFFACCLKELAARMISVRTCVSLNWSDLNKPCKPACIFSSTASSFWI